MSHAGPWLLLSLLLCLAGCGGPVPAAAGSERLTAGTGFYVRADGVLVTAAHVVLGCQRIEAAGQYQTVPARVLLVDPRSDLAVLRTDAEPAPAVLRVGPSQPGAGPLLALGYPGQGLSAALDEGRPRPLTARVRTSRADPRFRLWWQDERIVQGWSGGPVLDEGGGHVLGVVLAIMPDLNETARVLGAPTRGVAVGTDAAAVEAVLRRAGLPADGAGLGPVRQAVVRLVCRHQA